MSRRIEVHSGEQYGRLTTVVEIEPRISHSKRRRHIHRMVRCRCSCGSVVDVPMDHLRGGRRVSCGCLRGNHLIKHGHCGSYTYQIWKTMRQRCTNPRNRKYPSYGGRGIYVCDRWLHSFDNFLEDMGERPDGCSIDRIDNDGDYKPDNCRWATRTQQARNTRMNRYLTMNGETLCMSEWAERFGINAGTLKSRLNNGMTLAEALHDRIA